MSQPATRAFYLSHAVEPTYALFDGIEGSSNPVGVLLCPLFGNDDLCAYRARREWAKTLAAAGHPTLRFDLPGTGDSAGGPHDPGRIGVWTDAVAASALWLREGAGCARVVAIGIGLGGLLAYSAAANGAALDDLVLWSVPARGRVFVRQLRALSHMEASNETVAGDSGSALPLGSLASAGFLLSTETVTQLEGLDLTELELPCAPSRRVLLLERDGLPPDGPLHTALERSGVDLAVEPGPGYGAMVAPPQQSHAPVEVFASVNRWLSKISATPATPPPPTPIEELDELDLNIEGTRIREVPIALAHLDGQLTGVLAEPHGPARFCAVLLNAGALRHIGPNRMWVEMARRWAAYGVPTLRIDMAGIGDADGDASTLEKNEGFYTLHYVEQTRSVLNALVARGLPPRFVLCGLCSGAYWAFHAALEDERVRCAYLINPRVLFWNPHIPGVRDARNVRKTLYLRTWRKLLSGQITRERVGTIARGLGVALASLPGRLRGYLRSATGQKDDLGRALDRLSSTDTEVLGIFTAEEPVYEELERNGGLARIRAHANVGIELIPWTPTSHTLEPLPLQHAIHTRLDDALLRLLRRDPQADEPSALTRVDESTAEPTGTSVRRGSSQ